jgi:hypothetical protein
MSWTTDTTHNPELPEGLHLVETNTDKCNYCVGNTQDPRHPRHCFKLPSCSDGGNFMDEAMYIKWLTEERMK